MMTNGKQLFMLVMVSCFYLCCLVDSDARQFPQDRKMGQLYYVSPDASQDGTGSATHPFASIQQALEVAGAGDTVLLRGGEYSEQINFPRSGLPGKPIVLKAFPGEKVVLEGSKLVLPQWQGVVNILNQSHIVVEGIYLQNSPERGIVVFARAQPAEGIVIRQCQIANTARSGLAVEMARDVLLENCLVTGTRGGAPGYLLNQCEQLTVRNCRAWKNGLGGGGTAQGFLVLGGRNIQFVACLADSNVRDGFDIGGDQAGAENVLLDRCVARGNGEDGVGINSWAKKITLQRCLLQNNLENAINIYQGVQHVEIRNCTLIGGLHYLWIDGTDAPEVPITDVQILNSIGYGAQNRAIITRAPFADLRFDYNCWVGEYQGYGEFCLWQMGPGELEFRFADIGEQGQWYVRLGHGQHSFSASPRFVNPEKGDFRLREDSPCIDAGVDVGLPYQGIAPDLGAFEFFPAEP